jgi:prophage maintenance system killer protein
MRNTGIQATKGEILIYEKADRSVQIEVRSDGETVWLTENQVAELFDTTRQNVNLHVQNVIKDGELARHATCKESLQVRKEGGRNVERKITIYNLDMILSVGYRINSVNATNFRRWATTTLRHHLMEGYTVNQQRLEHLNKTIEILSRSADELVSGIAEVLNTFAGGLDLLDDYDHQSLGKPKGDVSDWRLGYDEARAFVDSMKFGKESDLFGREKDESFHGSLGAIYQTCGGAELYPSVQEKAANLLYMIVKDHSFTDGNKRIAAALFVYFLDKNGALLGKTGKPILSGNTLAAITLMIALSKPEEKEIMCALVMNMLDTGKSMS